MGDLRVVVGDKTVVIPVTLAPPAEDFLRWSTHGPFTTITAGQKVLLDVDVEVPSLTIFGTLEFDSTKNVNLRSRSSVVVEGGTLRMRPASAAVKHTLTFVSFTDAVFGVGGGDVVVPSDVGLWCHHAGVLDLHGAAKTAWTNLSVGTPANVSTFLVDDAAGWRVGDEIVVTSTTPHALNGRFVNQTDWERHTIQSVNGRQVTITAPLAKPHLSVSFKKLYQAEVLNLSRNVVVGGTATGRAHVHVMAHDGHGVPFNMDYVELAHVGPAKGVADSEGRYRTDVLGRYGLHFHKTEWLLRGSKMTGLVVRDSRGHAFVPHLSHGITFKDCISHVSHQTAFWWDSPTSGSNNEDSIPSHELVYDRCVASVTANGEGFFLGFGFDQVIRNCVVTGSINGNSFDNGVGAYNWQSSSRPLDHTVVPPGSSDAWIFEDNLAHNTNGPIRYWQNNVGNTQVRRLTAYYTNHAVSAGAYINSIDYLDYAAYRVGSENDEVSSFDSHASASPPGGLRDRFWIDANGENPHAMMVFRSPVPSGTPTVIRDGYFRGGTLGQILIDSLNLRVTGCTFVGNPYWFSSSLPATANIQVQDPADGRMYRLSPLSSTRGVARTSWNCRAELI